MAKSKWPEIEKKIFLVEMWVRDGMLEKDVAKSLKISTSTLEEYKQKHPEFAEALKRGREIIDYEVENSLYKKCVGTYAKEEKAFKCTEIYYDAQGNRCQREEIKTVEVDVFIPPDTTAIAIWLNNRRSDKWRRNANKEKLDQDKFEHDKDIDGKKIF